LLDDFSRLRDDAQLAFLLMHVDAYVLHGWPPLWLLTAFGWWAFIRPPFFVAASRFTPSLLFVLEAGATVQLPSAPFTPAPMPFAPPPARASRARNLRA
jgi:hypothetical protein